MEEVVGTKKVRSKMTVNMRDELKMDYQTEKELTFSLRVKNIQVIGSTEKKKVMV